MRLSDCLVIGISQSGMAEDVTQVIQTANACGALTVSITNNEQSVLAGTARHHLYCNVGIEKSVAATKTCSATMYLLACLLAEWTNDAHLKDELLSVPEGIRAVIAGNGQIEEIAARYRGIRECYMLARALPRREMGSQPGRTDLHLPSPQGRKIPGRH
jgi:glucosamine--fructose-6-phosphate aminotransferase (isomerizing)